MRAPATASASPARDARAAELARVLHRVAATARAHRMAEPGTLVLAAVSGGADSLCLLHALIRLRGLLGIDVACFHFDHGIRAGSGDDLAFVRAEAARLEVPFASDRASDAPIGGQSVEAWARTARYRALRTAAGRLGAGAIATGHTLDDQAETVLMACLRGGGLDAVSGIAPVAGDVVRPLLDVRRDETEAFCRALGLAPRHDPMNDDASFLRVALRRDVIPTVEGATGRGVAESLARTARLLRDDARFLDDLARQAESSVRMSDPSGEVILRAGTLAALPHPIAARVIRRAMIDAGAPGEAVHVDAILDLAAGRPGRSASLRAGLLARRDREYVRLSHRAGSGEA